MATAPLPPILIWQPAGGTPPGEQPVDHPPITNADLTQLIAGQAYIDVTFGTEQIDDEWIFVECSVINTTDPTPLNIWPTIITVKTSTGFRRQLNGMPDSANYFLHWAISGVDIPPPEAHPATTYTLTGPASGNISTPSTAFTVALPPGGTVASPVTVTPSDGGGGGTFTPTSVTLDTGSPSTTFTYTPASYGAKTISVINDGSLVDPASVAYLCVASTYSLTGPATGALAPSTNFTVALPVGGVLAGTVTVTPGDAGGGGTFTPTTVNLTTGAPSATFTYTPSASGAKTISTTNNGGLTDPGNLTYIVTAPASPHLLNTLISYWKLDEGSGTRNDSKGTNHLLEPAGTVNAFPAKINNGAYASGGTGVPYLTVANNATLQVTSDFTFSLWVRVDTVGSNIIALSKNNPAFSTIDYIIQHVAGSGFGFQIGSTIASVGTNATAFAFYHLVCWYDSSDGKIRLRVNDATTYTSAGAATLVQGTDAFAILASSAGIAPFNGLIDELGFWKRVLTAQEITALYNGGAGLPFSSFTA